MTLYEYFMDHLPEFHQFKINSINEEYLRYQRSPFLMRLKRWGRV